MSESKQPTDQSALANAPVYAWRAACKHIGYLRAGAEFRTLPKKNTSEYETIKQCQQEFLQEWTKLGAIPKEQRATKNTARKIGDVRVGDMYLPRAESGRSIVIHRMGMPDITR